MDVQEVKSVIAPVADSVPVLVCGPDHTYRLASAKVITALYDEHGGGWTQDVLAGPIGELTPYGRRCTAVLIEA